MHETLRKTISDKRQDRHGRPRRPAKSPAALSQCQADLLAQIGRAGMGRVCKGPSGQC